MVWRLAPHFANCSHCVFWKVVIDELPKSQLESSITKKLTLIFSSKWVFSKFLVSCRHEVSATFLNILHMHCMPTKNESDVFVVRSEAISLLHLWALNNNDACFAVAYMAFCKGCRLNEIALHCVHHTKTLPRPYRDPTETLPSPFETPRRLNWDPTKTLSRPYRDST